MTSMTDSAETVVVGSGVAGGLVACRLAAAGGSVLILEAGPWLKRAEIVENFRNSAAKSDFMSPYPPAPHALHPTYAPPNGYLIEKGEHPYGAQYIRAVGGTTWHWAAAAWRLLPSDFRLRSLYGVGKDWPITYEDLEPYYQAAEEALGVSGPQHTDVGSPRSRPYPMDALPLSWMDRRFAEVLNGAGFTVVPEPAARNSRPYDERPTCCGNNNCMPICPIAAQYAGEVHAIKAQRLGARLLANAVVYRIECDDKGLVQAVHYKRPDGGSVRVTGKRFVLAANGIETPKLMLMSTSERYPAGVGNQHDLVGRHLMDHPGTGVTFLAREALWPGRGPMEMTSVVNFRDGPFRREHAAKKLHLSNASQTRSAAMSLITEQGLAGKALETQLRELSARRLRIDSFHEQLPRPENRVLPSTAKRDKLGIAYPEVHYAVEDYVRRSAVHTRATYARIAQLMGGTDITFHDDFAPNNHIMGTTLMADNPSSGVVDRDCRVFGHDNLYVASSAVMPSAASVNCTLTIAALACRLSDHLLGHVLPTSASARLP